MRLQNKAKDEFNIEPISSAQMDAWIQECVQIYKGSPSWISVEDHIDTVCFAKAVCSETARLATLGIGIHIDGSARAKWLQEQIDKGVLHCDHCGKAFDLARGEGYVLDGACLCVACWE